MAYPIQMYRELCARLAPATPMDGDEVVEEITKGSNQTKGTALSFLAELEDVVVKNLKVGRTIKLSNGWTFQPMGKRDGSIEIIVRLPKKMIKAINNDFRGKWINAQNMSLSDDELIAIWNERHPDEPISRNGSTAPEEEKQPTNGVVPEAV